MEISAAPFLPPPLAFYLFFLFIVNSIMISVHTLAKLLPRPDQVTCLPGRPAVAWERSYTTLSKWATHDRAVVVEVVVLMIILYSLWLVPGFFTAAAGASLPMSWASVSVCACARGALCKGIASVDEGLGIWHICMLGGGGLYKALEAFIPRISSD